MKPFLVILFSCYSFFANATNYTVSSVEELNIALQKVKPSDIIIWKNGTYNDAKVSFKPTVKGTPNQCIYLKAETAGKVVFKGSSAISVNGDYLQVEGFLFEGTLTLDKDDVLAFTQNSNHCRITNCAVINYSPKGEFDNNNWISLQGLYNEVDHCYFSGKTNKGPYLVVRYKTNKDYVEGSDAAPSTHHHIHHNYFGYRTFSENGGEDMRIGDSKTSFTHGFNIIEYNYFEDQRIEAEIISNKSWDNIYRFNTFIANDGAMCLRHGQRCFVYGNYLDGKTGRNKKSGGLRVINANQTVFNNYVVNVEGSEVNELKAGIVVMCGLENSEINGYYAADSAVVAYNTFVNCAGPVIKVGVGNKSKGQPFITPKDISLVSNLVINSYGQDNKAMMEYETITYAECKNNLYTNGGSIGVKGFEGIKEKDIIKQNEFDYYKTTTNDAIIKTINQRLAIHNIHLTNEEITHFNPKWKLDKKDVGVSWIK